MSDTNKPRLYDLADTTERKRLLHETIGYAQVSLNRGDGTDRPGRQFAYDALKAAMKGGYRLEMSGWQPIETAPKDGTLVDVWARNGGRITNVRWMVEPREGVRHQNCITDGWKHPGDEPWGCLSADQFTHWMPLPYAPATTP